MKKYIIRTLPVDSGSLSISSPDYFFEHGGDFAEYGSTHAINRKPGKYKIKYEILNSWHELFKGETPKGEIILETISGMISIGDPCYWFPTQDLWEKYLKDTNMLQDIDKEGITIIDTGGDGLMDVILEVELLK